MEISSSFCHLYSIRPWLGYGVGRDPGHGICAVFSSVVHSTAENIYCVGRSSDHVVKHRNADYRSSMHCVSEKRPGSQRTACNLFFVAEKQEIIGRVAYRSAMNLGPELDSESETWVAASMPAHWAPKHRPRLSQTRAPSCRMVWFLVSVFHIRRINSQYMQTRFARLSLCLEK